MKLPHTLGHEIEGEVVALGPDAKGVKIGDRYAAFPWIGCGKCPACLRSEENHCLAAAPARLLVGDPGRLCHACDGAACANICSTTARHRPALAAAYMCSGITAFAAMKKVGKLGPGDEVMVARLSAASA